VPDTPTRTRALDAAIELLGTGGLRALTHARVDARADLPPGSTSNHFRTRAALVQGVVERLTERDLAQVGPTFSPTTPEELVAGLARVLEDAGGPDRVHSTARLVLFVEGSSNPAVREALQRGRERLEAASGPWMAQLGFRDPAVGAQAVVAAYEGLLLHRIARHDASDPRPVLDLVVRGALR
jgi:DNA-binding transcriptional regulator YbjK